jgi:hypothetical protein
LIRNDIEVQFKQNEVKINKREKSADCFHRLPKMGKKVVLEKYPAYFMI